MAAGAQVKDSQGVAGVTRKGQAEATDGARLTAESVGVDDGEVQATGRGRGARSRRQVTAGQRCFRASYARDEVRSILVEGNVAEGPAGIDGEELLNIYWALTRLSVRRCRAQEEF